ncbi:MAG TPA: flagellar assembly protein FliH [Burkholderiales bacterium]|nr:flagellar assembly protein FliH [Burkholderiales bacterium]
MNGRSFFSAEDLRGVKRWEPGSLGRDAAGAAQQQTEAKAAGARQRAQEEGYQAGFAAGNMAMNQLQGQLALVLQSARRDLAVTEQGVADNLLDLALDVARQIVRTDIKVRREHVLQVIREAMDCLPQSTPNPKLFLHPNDVDLVKAHVGDELSVGGWRLVEDHRVEPGGCRISSPNCEVDATLSTRWKRVIASLGRDTSWIESEPQA